MSTSISVHEGSHRDGTQNPVSWNSCIRRQSRSCCSLYPPGHRQACSLFRSRRYMKSARDDAPYLPSNIDFAAANNGLEGAEDVRKTLMDASYMVLGLGGAGFDC